METLQQAGLSAQEDEVFFLRKTRRLPDMRKARLPDTHPLHLEGHLPQKRKAVSYFTEEIPSVLKLQ